VLIIGTSPSSCRPGRRGAERSAGRPPLCWLLGWCNLWPPPAR